MPARDLGLMFAVLGCFSGVSAVLRLVPDLATSDLDVLGVVLGLVGVALGITVLFFGLRLRRKGDR